MDNNNHKRKHENDEGGSEGSSSNVEKKVRFKADPPDFITIDSRQENNYNKNDGSENIVKIYNDDEMLEQIRRADQKQQEREAEIKKREKLFVAAERLSTAREVVDDDGVIHNVEGEEDQEDDDDDDVDMKLQRRYQKQEASRHHHLDGNKIERQEDDDDSEDDVEVIPFNLREDRSEGRFKADGTYEREDIEEEDDPWLKEYDETMRKKMPKVSRKEMARQEAAQREEDDDEDQWEKEERELALKKRKGLTFEERDTRRHALTTVVKILQPGETVLVALRRLGGGNKKPVLKKKQQQNRSNKTTTTTTTTNEQQKEDSMETNEEELKQQQFSDLTDSSNFLLANGYMNIYSDKKESVQAILNKDIGKSQPQQTTASTANDGAIQWEYKLSDGNVYSGFSSEDMKGWIDSGVFTGHGVVARKVGTTDNFVEIETLNF